MSIGPQSTLPVLAVALSNPGCPAFNPLASINSSLILASPDISASCTSDINSFRALLVGELSIIDFIFGNISSIDLSISLDIVLANRASPPASPFDFLNSANASGVQPLLDLNHDPTLSIHRSNLLLAISNSFFLFLNFLIVAPVPPIKPVNIAPSVPNLILFNKSLTASLPSVLSISVGPPKRSPKLPTS